MRKLAAPGCPWRISWQDCTRKKTFGVQTRQMCSPAYTSRLSLLVRGGRAAPTYTSQTHIFYCDHISHKSCGSDYTTQLTQYTADMHHVGGGWAWSTIAGPRVAAHMSKATEHATRAVGLALRLHSGAFCVIHIPTPLFSHAAEHQERSSAQSIRHAAVRKFNIPQHRHMPCKIDISSDVALDLRRQCRYDSCRYDNVSYSHLESELLSPLMKEGTCSRHADNGRCGAFQDATVVLEALPV